MAAEIEVHERTVVKRYVTLPYLWETPGYHAPDWSKPDPHNHQGPWVEGQHKEGTVDIDLDVLAELADYSDNHDRFFDRAFIDLPAWADYALEAIGWGTRATRGGVWATDVLRGWLQEQGLR